MDHAGLDGSSWPDDLDRVGKSLETGFGSMDLGQVGLNLTGRQALRGKRGHHLVHAGQAWDYKASRACSTASVSAGWMYSTSRAIRSTVRPSVIAWING